jgi:hypothetical protein
MATWKPVSCLFWLARIFILTPLLATERPPHIIDVTCQEGLLDMISLGCLIEFSRALDHRMYAVPEQSIPEDEGDEIDAAQSRYRRFILWYQDQFFIVINGQHINPAYIFQRRLLDFASTLLLYVQQQETDFHTATPDEHTLTEDSLMVQLHDHISSGWDHLTDAFLELKKYPSPRLYYDGPTIEIRAWPHDWKRRFDALGLLEINELPSAPLQVSALKEIHKSRPIISSSIGVRSSGESEQEEEEDDDDEDMGNGSDASSASSSLSTDGSVAPQAAPKPPSTPRRRKRTRQPSYSSPKSPSSSRKAKRQR